MHLSVRGNGLLSAQRQAIDWTNFESFFLLDPPQQIVGNN